MEAKIILTDEQVQFLSGNCTVLCDDGKPVWYYQPYWFERIKGNTFAVHAFDKLPARLVQRIEADRGMWSGIRSSIEQVTEFHQVFGHPIGDEPKMPEQFQMIFRRNFIKEELDEIAYIDKLPLEKEDALVSLADGLGDIQYVLDGWFLNAGLQHKKDAIVSEIHRSNMTKVCKTEEEAQKTIDYIVSQAEIGVRLAYYYEKHGEYYIVYRSHDRKVMKSINYEAPNLKKIVYG